MSELDDLLFALTKVAIKDQIVAKHGRHNQKDHGRKGREKPNITEYLAQRREAKPRDEVREPGSFWNKYGIKNDGDLSWQEGTLIASGVLVGTGAGLAIGLNSAKIGQAYDDFIKYGMNAEGQIAAIGVIELPESHYAKALARLDELDTAGYTEARTLHDIFNIDLGNGYSATAGVSPMTEGYEVWDKASEEGVKSYDIIGDIWQDKGGKRLHAGNFSRTFTPDKGVMEHAVLILRPAHQDSGAGNALFQKSIEAYKKAGFVDEVEVHTAWVGGYNWAKQGYQFENGVMPDSIRQMLTSEVSNKRNDARIKEEISTLLTRDKAGEVVTPLEIANIGQQYKRDVWRPGKPRLSMHAGKGMMIGQSWNGRLPITPKGEAALAARTKAALSASPTETSRVKFLIGAADNPAMQNFKRRALNGGATPSEVRAVRDDYKNMGFTLTGDGYWEAPSVGMSDAEFGVRVATPIQDQLGGVEKHLLGRHNQKTHGRDEHKKSESYLLNQDVKRWLTDEYEGGPVGSGIAYIRSAYERNKTKTALGRLFDAKATPTDGILYRGVASNAPEIRQPGAVLKFGLSSFSSSPKVAFEFAKKRAKNGEQAAVIRMAPGAQGLDISPYYNLKTDTFRLHRRKKEYIVKGKARVSHTYVSNGITVIEVKPYARRTAPAKELVGKHAPGQHNQKEHGKKKPRSPKPKYERTLWNKMGYERDGKLSDAEFFTGLVGGMVAFSVGYKLWEGFNKVNMDRRYGDKIHQAIGDKLNSGEPLGTASGLGFHPEGQRFRTGFRKWAARFENVRFVREYQATGVWEEGLRAKDLMDTAEKITKAEADTMINVLAAAPALEKPIFRGVAINSKVLESMVEGKEIDMPISSFSRNKSIAMSFTTPVMIGARGQKHVIFEVAPGARGVDVTELLPEGLQWGEEVLSHGTYKVAGTSKTTIGKLIDEAQENGSMRFEAYFPVTGWMDEETKIRRLAGLLGEGDYYDPEVTIVKLIQTATSFANLTIQKRRVMV